jgi:multiple sugar transport system permease protein
MSAWGVGGEMLIFLAGLKGIPQILYEAAEIDGAGRPQRFLRITLPILSPTIFFNLVMAVIGSFQTFDSAFVISTARAGAIGSPLKSTLFYMMYLYQKAFSDLRMGYASAMAWLLFVVIVAVTYIINRTSQRWVFYGD